MATLSTQELTLNLPTDSVEMFLQTVARRRQPPDIVVAEALRYSLQPLSRQALRQLNRQIEKQKKKSPRALQAQLEARLPDAEQARLSELLERNRETGLRRTDIRPGRKHSQPRGVTPK